MRAGVAQQTAMMENDVVAMEQRLAALKATMTEERAKRSEAQLANPSGSVWRSARTDVPVRGGKYVEQVLAAKPAPQKKAPPQDEGAAMGRTGNRFDLVDHGPLMQPTGDGMYGAAPAAGSGLAALRSSAGTSTFAGEGAGATRRPGEWERIEEPPRAAAPGEWNPMAAMADAGNDYEDLLGPVDEPFSGGGYGGGGGGGGALWGTFDEEANKSSFAAAVAEFRGEAPPPPRPMPVSSSLLAQPRQPPVSGMSAGTDTNTGGGGALWGTFDEEANKADFAAAVASFRGERAPPPPRFALAPAPAPAPAPARVTMTLAQKMAAINAELGLPTDLPMTEAVAQANAVTGLAPRGTLFDQVTTLMTELGLQQQQPPPPPQQHPPRPPQQTSPSRAMATQASTGPNFFELLQQQKRKDGVL